MGIYRDHPKEHGLLERQPAPFELLKGRIRQLYEGETPGGIRFRYALLALDVVTVLFIVATSFLPRSGVIEALDIVFGVLILADFCARLIISRHPLHEFARLSTWTDIVVIISFLAPLTGEAGGFLRTFRTLRLLRDYQIVTRLRVDSTFFRRNEEVVFAVANLAVFIFVMTGIVYETQKSHNHQIANYADALYFTVTALTTTGFGDITLPGTFGRLITVVIMIFGVTLFLNLAKALLAPSKVRFPCPACGLQRHDVDAVHCKACGIVLNIPDEGSD
ncbi:potassium channel family protein [Bradyrhizobium tropiciagri]|uniref:potassium channel family protein n=1 Tax=Bradyrhizobium tropiciagri TaxID=312253 RepID=UPI001BAD0A21|nr:potassium channel family protein [Bradyrhizobium tropiciagri]MBR0875096.1 potassium channel family protein [Bradyrhizobium tropiciagri]